MRINHNMSGLVAYNAYTLAQRGVAKAIERLSSGLRINSAADDASGLAISEKMTSQIRGLDQAARNAQDGTSMLRTAEGALGEIHSIIQRMRELSVQAANDTLMSEDRSYIQLEIDELTKQINDVANQTQFNKKRILNGDSAILWSTSTGDISVVVGGTLLSKDIFGQTESAAGNYKISFSELQAGNESVQKSNIMYLKHGTLAANVTSNDASGLRGLSALNMVEGSYSLEARNYASGGVIYFNNATDSDAPATVGAKLEATPSANTSLASGDYYVQVAENVPMMADFDAALSAGVVLDVNMSSRGASQNFDAVFDIDADVTAGSSVTSTQIAGDISGAVNGIALNTGTLGGNAVAINVNAANNLNVFTRYEVINPLISRALFSGTISITLGTTNPATAVNIAAGSSIEDVYNALSAALSAPMYSNVSVGWNMQPGGTNSNGRFTLTNNEVSDDLTLDLSALTGVSLFGTASVPVYAGGGIATTDPIQARDMVRLSVEWSGNDANGTVVSGSQSTVVWEGADMNLANIASMNGIGLGNFYTDFLLKDGSKTSDFAMGDSWIVYTQAAVSGTADMVELNMYDGKYGVSMTNIKYAFNNGALNSSQATNLRNMIYVNKSTYDNIEHSIRFGNVNADVSFQYGERSGGGNAGEWGMGGSGNAWYSQAYYGNDTTNYFASGANVSSVVSNVRVYEQNDVNMSFMFTYKGGGNFEVSYRGYDRNSPSGISGSAVIGAGTLNSGSFTLGGVKFTGFNVSTSGLTSGDKFVVNVAAAAKLDSVNSANPSSAADFQSNENIIMYDDLSRMGGTGAHSVMQYRFVNGVIGSTVMQIGDYVVNSTNGGGDHAGIHYYDGTFSLDPGVTAPGFNSDGGVYNPVTNNSGLATTPGYMIRAEVNIQGKTAPIASALLTSAFIQDMESDSTNTKRFTDYVRAVSYSDYKYTSHGGSYGPADEITMGTGNEVYNPYNGSLIFEVIGVTDNVLKFRVQGHIIDVDGNYTFAVDEDFRLNGESNTMTDSTAVPPLKPPQEFLPVVLFADVIDGGLIFDEFTLADYSNWTVGDRFSLALTASGFGGEAKHDMDELTAFSDLRGTGVPISYRFNDGVLDDNTVDLRVYQLNNNTIKPDSVNWTLDQVMDGTLSLSFGEYIPGAAGRTVIRDAAVFDVVYKRGMDAGVAHYYSRLEDIKQFWDTYGKFMLEGGGEALSIRQDGKEIKIALNGDVEIGKLAEYMSERIWLDLLMQYDGAVRGPDYEDSVDYNPYLMDERDKHEIIQFVNTAPGPSENESVAGTFLAHSVLTGKGNDLKFYGSDRLMRALSFVTIQEAADTMFSVSVSDAHSGRLINGAVKISAGDRVSGLIADGVSLDIDSTIGLVRSAYDAARGTFKAEVQDRFDQYVHLADNAARLQIGANEGENMILTLGAMTAHALGISDIDVRSREAAARGITRLDNALSRVSSQRAIIGSQINRLEHTINNLTTASANTTAAESRIRDTDMAKEMMNFTKLNILTMMGSSMMAQANMIPENILPLMR